MRIRMRMHGRMTTRPAAAASRYALSGLLMLTAGLLLLLASCDLDAPLPPVLDAGSADFTRMAAVGNSLTAGFQSGGLVEDFQALAFPALIARQAGHTIGNDDFAYPNISYPGIPAVLGLSSAAGPVIEPISTSTGTPTNTAFQGIYANLGVPGAVTAQFLANPAESPQNLNPYFAIVARPSGFDSMSVAQLAVATQPTFIVVWAGNNDVLGAVTGGEPAALTPVLDFQTAYEALLDTLATSGAGMVTANIPEVTSIPFATTIPPVVVDPQTQEPVTLPDGSLVALIGETDSGTPGPLDPRSLVTLPAADSLRAGVGIPTAIPGGTGRPLPDSMVLTPNELAEIQTRTSDLNRIISDAATNRGIPLVDMNALLIDLAANGKDVAGIELETSFVTGGLFSLDGIHPTTVGYGVVANAFIETINAHYGSNLQPVDLNALLAVSSQPQQTGGLVATGAGGAAAGRGTAYRLSAAAWRQLRGIFETRP